MRIFFLLNAYCDFFIFFFVWYKIKCLWRVDILQVLPTWAHHNIKIANLVVNYFNFAELVDLFAMNY